MSDPIVQRLAEDLDDGFVAVVDAFGPMVLAIAGALGDRAAREDVAQETFLRAYRHLREVDPTQRHELELRPWLATIARNVTRNEWRRRSRKPTVQLTHGNGTSLAAPHDHSPEATVDRGAVGNELTVLLAELPAPQREAIVLRHVVGLSTRETAQVTGRPQGTVKSDLARGLAALRLAIEASMEEAS